MTNIGGFIIYAIIVSVSYIYAFKKRPQDGKKAAKRGIKQLIKQIPFLISIFLLIGLFDQFVSKDTIVSMIGHAGKWYTVITSALLGSIAMGSVSSAYPLGRILLKKGATLTSIAILLNAWVMVGIITMPYEISIFGKKFTLTRNALSFVGAILIGITVGFIIGGTI